MTKPCIVFIANRGYALKSSRENLIKYYIDSGWDVVLATAEDTESLYLKTLGANIETIEFNRGGISLRADFSAYIRLKSFFKKRQPLIVHNFHAKPVILASLAAKSVLGNSVKVVNTITGLGHAFIVGGLVAKIAGLGYRLALPKADMTIFQNRDDKALFIDNGWSTEDNSLLIVGSGVDVKSFNSTESKNGSNKAPTIVMLGRLLRQKGVAEFIEVAKCIHQYKPEAKFFWAGEEDDIHPDAVTRKWIVQQGGIEFLGRLSDVRPLLSGADLFLFPSYREGVPRAVMEASSSGVPTIAFDVPGVREAVKNNETGYLVPIHDVASMVEKVKFLLENEDIRLQMGCEARCFAEQAFDIKSIQKQYINMYRKLGVDI